MVTPNSLILLEMLILSLHNVKDKLSKVLWLRLISMDVLLDALRSKPLWENQSCAVWRPLSVIPFSVPKSIERLSYDLEMKAREQNRNDKRTEIERFDWFIERTNKRVWLFIG